MQIACGDITDIEFQNDALVVATDEKFILNTLEKPEHKQIIEDALKWQGLHLQLVVKRKIKLTELQEQDIAKLKGLGLEVKIKKGD